MHRFRPSSHFVPVLISLSLVLAGCSDDGGTAPGDEDVRDYIVALATSGGVQASFVPGPLPAFGSGPTIDVDGNSAMILGGSAIRVVSSTEEFSRILVAVEDVDGYWEITLPAPSLIEELILTLAQNIATALFELNFALGDAGGIGFVETELVPVQTVGTGVVQVSVTWNSDADVDLYVVDPSSEEIYYGHPFSASGGMLDLDSNAGCSGDNIRNENITWGNSAPSGTYTVRVNLWDACETTSTDYVVTVRRKDQPPLTYSGTLTGPGNNGGAGDGEVVTSFTY